MLLRNASVCALGDVRSLVACVTTAVSPKTVARLRNEQEDEDGGEEMESVKQAQLEDEEEDELEVSARRVDKAVLAQGTPRKRKYGRFGSTVERVTEVCERFECAILTVFR